MTAPLFVKQQYLDFLNRQPDQAGWGFWTNEITSCGTECAMHRGQTNQRLGRILLSIEFQQTGNLVYKCTRLALVTFWVNRSRSTVHRS
jgi:hypothetical protein